MQSLLSIVTEPGVTGLFRLDQDIPLDNLDSVVRVAQHYYSHLLRENPHFLFINNARLNSKVTLDFYKLKQTGTFVKTVRSIGDPIEKVIVGQNTIYQGRRKVVADNTTWDGIKLKYMMTVPFCPYFDNSDLCIRE